MSSIARRGVLMPTGYQRTRLLVTTAGTALLFVVAAIMAVRGVDATEVIAALLYVPILLALMTGGARGGVVAGVAAAGIYVGLRWSAMSIVGPSTFFGLIAFRTAAYVAFGAIGGWASGQLESPLRKLEEHDLIDDATGLFNARFLLRHTAVESARADRYETPFSVVSFSIPAAALATLSRRAREDLKRAVAELVRARIRTVDRPIYADAGQAHLFAVVLGETPAQGAAVVETNLQARIEEVLAGAGAPAAVATTTVSYPDDAEGLVALQETFRRVDHMEHPDESSHREAPR